MPRSHRVPVVLVLEGDVAEWVLALAKSMGIGPDEVVARILSHLYTLLRPISRCDEPGAGTRAVFVVEPEGPRVVLGEPRGEELVKGIYVADRITKRVVKRAKRDIYVGRRFAGSEVIVVTYEGVTKGRLELKRVYTNGEVTIYGMRGRSVLVAYGEKGVYIVPLEQGMGEG